ENKDLGSDNNMIGQSGVRLVELVLVMLLSLFAGFGKFHVHKLTSLSWSAYGSTLFSGYTDGVVGVWGSDATRKVLN
ncbi:hypothetical protein M8C21_025686, partial [Ambrosia artemisiifolia]